MDIGTRVRVMAGNTLASKIAAGKTGVVVERSERLVEAESIAHRDAFPISMKLDDSDRVLVWGESELEVIS